MNSNRFVDEEIDAQLQSSDKRLREPPATSAPRGAGAPDPITKDACEDDLYADMPCTD